MVAGSIPIALLLRERVVARKTAERQNLLSLGVVPHCRGNLEYQEIFRCYPRADTGKVINSSSLKGQRMDRTLLMSTPEGSQLGRAIPEEVMVNALRQISHMCRTASLKVADLWN